MHLHVNMRLNAAKRLRIFLTKGQRWSDVHVVERENAGTVQHPTLRSLVNFCVDLEQFSCSLSTAFTSMHSSKPDKKLTRYGEIRIFSPGVQRSSICWARIYDELNVCGNIGLLWHVCVLGYRAYRRAHTVFVLCMTFLTLRPWTFSVNQGSVNQGMWVWIGRCCDCYSAGDRCGDKNGSVWPAVCV